MGGWAEGQVSVDPGARTLKKSVVYICWSENNFDEQKVKCKQKKLKMFQLLYDNLVIMIVKLQLSR